MRSHPRQPSLPALLLVLMTALTAMVPTYTWSQGGPGGGARGAAGGGAAAGRSGGGPVAEATVSERSHVITAGGRLEPRTRLEHGITSAGYVESIAVTEGSLVTAGSELLRIRRKDDVLELYQPIPLTARVTGRIAAVEVQVASEVTVGQNAVTIIATDGFRLIANISDKDAFRVEIGSTVTGTTAAGNSVTATLATRSQEPDYITGLFELTFHLSSTPGVRIGEFVLLELPLDRVRGIFVPREAVIRRYGSFYLWLITEGSTLEAREVSPGEAFDEELLIISGLTPGERFLRAPSGREREGAPAPTASTGQPGN